MDNINWGSALLPVFALAVIAVGAILLFRLLRAGRKLAGLLCIVVVFALIAGGMGSTALFNRHQDRWWHDSANRIEDAHDTVERVDVSVNDPLLGRLDITLKEDVKNQREESIAIFNDFAEWFLKGGGRQELLAFYEDKGTQPPEELEICFRTDRIDTIRFCAHHTGENATVAYQTWHLNGEDPAFTPPYTLEEN